MLPLCMAVLMKHPFQEWQLRGWTCSSLEQVHESWQTALQKYLWTRINISSSCMCGSHGPVVLWTAQGYVNPDIHGTHAFLLIHFKGSGSSQTSLGGSLSLIKISWFKKKHTQNPNSCFYSGWLRRETLSLGHSYKDFLHLFGSHYFKKRCKKCWSCLILQT